MGNHGSNLDDILAEDMHHWYNMFMRESPSGLITLFELKAILNLKGMSENANSYVDQVFFTFDMDGVGAHTQKLGFSEQGFLNQSSANFHSHLVSLNQSQTHLGSEFGTQSYIT